jgi:hypothetical protein
MSRNKIIQFISKSQNPLGPYDLGMGLLPIPEAAPYLPCWEGIMCFPIQYRLQCFQETVSVTVSLKEVLNKHEWKEDCNHPRKHTRLKQTSG